MVKATPRKSHQPKVHTHCAKCGLTKYADARKLCLQCAWNERQAPRDPGPGDVIRQLDQAIANEVAMPWDRKGRP